MALNIGNVASGLPQANPWGELSTAISQMPQFKMQQLQAEQMEEQVAQTGYNNLITAALQNPMLATNPGILRQMQQYATQMKIPAPITKNEAGLPTIDMKLVGNWAATQWIEANADKWYNWSPDQRLSLANAHNWGLAPDDPLIQAPQSVSVWQASEIQNNMLKAIDTASKMAGTSGSDTAFAALATMRKAYDQAMGGVGAYDALITQLQPTFLQDIDRGTQRLAVTNKADLAKIAQIRDRIKNADSMTTAELAYKDYQNVVEKYKAQYAPAEEQARLANLQQRTETSAQQAEHYRALAGKGGLTPLQAANYAKGAWQASSANLKDLVHQAQAIQYDIANAAPDADTTNYNTMLQNTLDQLKASEPLYFSDLIQHAITTANISGNQSTLAVAQAAESALEAFQGNTLAASIDVIHQKAPRTYHQMEAQFPDLVKFIAGQPTSYESDATQIAAPSS